MKTNLAIYRRKQEKFGNLSKGFRNIWQFIEVIKKYLTIYRRNEEKFGNFSNK